MTHSQFRAGEPQLCRNQVTWQQVLQLEQNLTYPLAASKQLPREPECNGACSVMQTDNCPAAKTLQITSWSHTCAFGKHDTLLTWSIMLYTLCAAPRAVANVWMLGEVWPTVNAPISTTKNTWGDTRSVSWSKLLFSQSPFASSGSARKEFGDYSSTHSEYGSNGVLLLQDECTSVPEGQSVGQVDHQEVDAKCKIGICRLLYSHVLCILQVFNISAVQETHRENSSTEGKCKHKWDCNGILAASVRSTNFIPFYGF